jgi:hypothetical protein
MACGKGDGRKKEMIVSVIMDWEWQKGESDVITCLERWDMVLSYNSLQGGG